MAIDHISVNKSAPMASLLIAAINAQRTGYERMKQVREVMSHLNDGSDWTALETAFGIAAGKGQVLFDLVNGSVGTMEGTFQTADAKTITEKVG